MPFYELVWKDDHYEETKDSFSFSAVLDKRQHFKTGNPVAFCLLNVQAQNEPNAAPYVARDVARILSGFFNDGDEDRRNNYQYLATEDWEPGYTDSSQIRYLYEMLIKMVNDLASPPFSLNRKDRSALCELASSYRDFDDQLKKSISCLHCNVHLFVISVSCYELIKASTEELPKMVAGIFSYKNDGKTKLEVERLHGKLSSYICFTGYYDSTSFREHVKNSDPDLVDYLPEFYEKHPDLFAMHEDKKEQDDIGRTR